MSLFDSKVSYKHRIVTAIRVRALSQSELDSGQRVVLCQDWDVSYAGYGLNTDQNNITDSNGTSQYDNIGHRVDIDHHDGDVVVLDPAYFKADKGKADFKLYSRTFSFDMVLWSIQGHAQFADQEDVYRQCGRPLVTHCLEGFNASLIAYGQTGSGKTYTMIGDSENPGVIPLLCGDLIAETEKLVNYQYYFDSKNGNSNKGNMVSEAKISASFYEIYNERVYDLLSASTDTPCRVREHPVDGAYVENLAIRPIKSYDDVAALLEEGKRKRSTAATLVNVTSSRSHAIFTLYLEQKIVDLSSIDTLIDRVSDLTMDANSIYTTPTRKPSITTATSAKSQKRNGSISFGDPLTTTSATRYSRINLVDLAGSERVSLTGVTGQQLVEANNINKSLSTLGDVIKALSDASGKLTPPPSTTARNASSASVSPAVSQSLQSNSMQSSGLSSKESATFIPYRNSTLTWLLRESLGGNSRTAMIAAVSPTDYNYQETLSTLRYIERVKAITQYASRNDILSETSAILSLNAQVEQLQRELQASYSEQNRLLQEMDEQSAMISYLHDIITEREKRWPTNLDEQLSNMSELLHDLDASMTDEGDDGMEEVQESIMSKLNRSIDNHRNLMSNIGETIPNDPLSHSKVQGNSLVDMTELTNAEALVKESLEALWHYINDSNGIRKDDSDDTTERNSQKQKDKLKTIYDDLRTGFDQIQKVTAVSAPSQSPSRAPARISDTSNT